MKTLAILLMIFPLSNALFAEEIDPRIYTAAGAGIHLYLPDAIPGIDRFVWHASVAVGIQFTRLFGIEGEFRYGGIIYADRGYISLVGGHLGFFMEYMPENGTWSDRLYLRGGFCFELFERMRYEQMFLGLYAAPGISIPLGSSGRFFLDNEFFFQRTFPDMDGGMGHWRIGLRNSLRIKL